MQMRKGLFAICMLTLLLFSCSQASVEEEPIDVEPVEEEPVEEEPIEEEPVEEPTVEEAAEDELTEEEDVEEKPNEEKEVTVNPHLRPLLNDMVINSEGRYPSNLITFVRNCWEEDVDEPCEVEYRDAADRVREEKVLSVSPGESIQAFFYADPIEFELPNLMEVFLMDEEGGGEKELVATGEGPNEISFNVTEKEGVHYYLVRLEWDNRIRGEAYYVVRLLVR